MKLKEINLLYSGFVVDNSWVDMNEQSNPNSWNLLTNDSMSMKLIVMKKQGNNYAKQNEQYVTNANPTVMHNLDGPNIDPSQIVNIAPEEAQIPVYHINEPDCEALGFPK